MKKTIRAMAISLALTLGLIGPAVLNAPVAHSAPMPVISVCAGESAFCLFADSNKGGDYRLWPKGVCWAQPNFKNISFNDVASSADNWVNNTQAMWRDANYVGTRWDVPPYAYIPSFYYRWGAAAQDSVSSMIGVG